LLSTPARADRVFAYKFQGALAFSSWAFVLLGTPVLIAYGRVQGAQWHYYALLPLFCLGFVLLPGSVGALLCLLVINFVPRRRKHLLVAAVITALAVALLVSYQMAVTAQEAEFWNKDLVQRLLGRFSFLQGPLVPTHWVTRGLQEAAQGELAS